MKQKQDKLSATGRLIKAPNLQNVPIRTEEGRRIRQALSKSFEECFRRKEPR